jgi:hypothetical protein
MLKPGGHSPSSIQRIGRPPLLRGDAGSNPVWVLTCRPAYVRFPPDRLHIGKHIVNANTSNPLPRNEFQHLTSYRSPAPGRAPS